MKKIINYCFLLALLAFSYSLNAADNVNCQHCGHLRTECLTMREHAGGATGKWVDNATPKRGWTCTGAEDLGEPNKQCEMCESETVRYIHHMKHGNQNPILLDVGCICAGHMEGRFLDQERINQAVKRAQNRASELQNIAARRAKFTTLEGWKVSKSGNNYINKFGYNITIMKSKYNNKYTASIKKDSGEYESIGVYLDTIDAAKYAAFDHIWPPKVQ